MVSGDFLNCLTIRRLSVPVHNLLGTVRRRDIAEHLIPVDVVPLFTFRVCIQGDEGIFFAGFPMHFHDQIHLRVLPV